MSSEQDDEPFSEVEKVFTYKKEQEMNLAKMPHFERSVSLSLCVLSSLE